MRQLNDNTLLIEKVMRDDAGTYICHAQVRGRPIYKQLSVSVVINGQYLLLIMISIVSSVSKSQLLHGLLGS